MLICHSWILIGLVCFTSHECDMFTKTTRLWNRILAWVLPGKRGSLPFGLKKTFTFEQHRWELVALWDWDRQNFLSLAGNGRNLAWSYYSRHFQLRRKCLLIAKAIGFLLWANSFWGLPFKKLLEQKDPYYLYYSRDITWMSNLLFHV